jgi:MinD-like ATPase involved in chromosome partitioning or flagellar assembly
MKHAAALDANWLSRLKGLTLKSREPASRSYRFMSRLIEREYAVQPGHGLCFALTSPDSERLSTDALLMLAYAAQSELDCRVLVIDARPGAPQDGLTARLGLAQRPGLSEALASGTNNASQSIHPTAVPNIDAMPAGLARVASGGMDRDKLAAMIADLKTRYGQILLLTGSVQADTRSLAVVASADAVFLLAQENRTLFRALDDCQTTLLKNGVKDVRVVMVGEVR